MKNHVHVDWWRGGRAAASHDWEIHSIVHYPLCCSNYVSTWIIVGIIEELDNILA